MNATLKGRALTPPFISKSSLFLTRELLVKVQGVEGSFLYSFVYSAYRITFSCSFLCLGGYMVLYQDSL